MDWESLFTGISNKMRQSFDMVRAAVEHRGTKGAINEKILAEFLSLYLPAKIGICPAEAIDSNGSRSKQLDVIAYDAASTPKFYAADDFQVIPIESVYAVFEVKAVLTLPEIESAFENMKVVKALEKKAYFYNLPCLIKTIYGQESRHWPVQFFIFAFESPMLSTVYEHIKRLNATQPLDKRIDSVCVLNKGLITNLVPAGLQIVPSPDSTFVIKETDKSLLTFYALINTLLAQTDSAPINVNEYLKHIKY